MKYIGLFVLGLWLGASVCGAAETAGPGWFNAGWWLSTSGEGDTNNPPRTPPPPPLGEPATSIAEASTPEIQALASGLENDPKRIFDFVHDHIRHVLYFGSKKGAQLTLLERSGNDFDQCALLVALLRAAGHTNASYQFGMLKMPYYSPDSVDLQHWLGLSLVNTNWSATSNLFSYVIGSRGYPTWWTYDDTNSIAFHRVWVKLPIGGTNYCLDPAFKVSKPIMGIDLTNAMGLSTNALMTAAAGTTSADSVQDLNEEALRSKLTEYTTNLLGALQSNFPNSSVEEIIGGQQIVFSAATPLSQALLFPVFTNDSRLQVLDWNNQPTNLMHKFSISIGATNYEWIIPELQGQRLTLVFDTNGVAKVWREDTALLQTTTSGSGPTTTVTLSANHPFGYWDYNNNTLIDWINGDQSAPASYRRTNATYALIYAFDSSEEELRRRQQQLDTYREQGWPDASRQVVSETLNVMGLNYLWQSALAGRVVNAHWDSQSTFHHCLGRMAQESGNGYYLDFFAVFSALIPNGGSDSANKRCFDVTAYFYSAFEHGMIEQLQSSNLVAASTVKMLQLANTNSLKIYLANSNNWTTVQTQLTNYDLVSLGGFINAGFNLLLPRDGSRNVAGSGSWKGYGLVARIETPQYLQTQMLIGGLYGGYAPFANLTISTPVVYQASYVQPNYFSAPSPFVGGLLGADPVEMSDASFRVSETDLTLGQAPPRGLTFTRHYSPTRRHHNLAGIAPGWMHNYYVNVSEVSAPQAGLGWTTPAQMAPMLVATRAALELYDSSPNAKNWAVTAIITKWGVDTLLTNAVSVSLGADTLQFVKQPDGSFTPPAKCTMTLQKTNSVYRLQERHGNTFKFDTLGRLTNIVDQYQQPLTVSYLSSTSNLPQTVMDWKGRTLTFTYTSNRLTLVTDNTGRSVSYGYSTTFNTNGDLVSVTDPENKTSTFLYDTNHQIIATSNALNQLVVSNLYDAFGRVATQYTQGDANKMWRIYWSDWETVEQNPAGNKRRFSYDDKHRLIALQDALGDRNQTLYDGQDHVVTTISPLSETNRFEFDGRHNLLRSIDALNFTNQSFYDAQDNLVRTVDTRGNTNRFGYNSKFQLTGTTNGAGDWVTFVYNDADGTLTNRTDPGGVTGYTYDGNGLLSGITYPGGLGSVSFVNHPRGDVTNLTNARGFLTSFQYNQRRELTNTIAPTNVTAKVAYDAVGNVLSTTDARGFSTTNYWSATRKLLATTLPGTPQGVTVTTNVYDGRDWLMYTIQNPGSAISATTRFTNNVAQQLISVTDPLLRTTRFGYDGVGRNIATTNAAQEVTRQEWNKRGELTNLTDAATHTVKRGYDSAGNQVALTNRNSKRWQFYFDAANRLTNTVTPLSRETRIAYDARGLVSTVREPSTQTTANFYDAKGRQTNRADQVGSILYRYDANNNVTNIAEAGKTNSWTFDAYDRVNSYKDADGNTINYRYDANGNLTNLIYPGGRTVTYSYDSLNRLTNVTDWANRKTSFEYDLANRLTRITRPNGSIREMGYDASGQATNIVERLTNNAPIAVFKFNWNSAARVEWEFTGPLPHTYTPLTRTMTYNDDNQIATFNGNNITHDTDGNMTCGPLTNSTFVTYGYDARNRLTNLVGVAFTYDPAGNRTAMSNAAGVARFIINPNAPLSQILVRTKGTVTNYYIYGVSLLYEITETASTTNTLTYHFDFRGSTVALTDGNGWPTDRIEYSPYGTTTYRAGTNDTPFLFNGRYGVQSDPNGLFYMRARYYNPYLCRFINADPAGFSAGLNFYAYADGNPVSMTDPFGLGADSISFSESASWVNSGSISFSGPMGQIAEPRVDPEIEAYRGVGFDALLLLGAGPVGRVVGRLAEALVGTERAAVVGEVGLGAARSGALGASGDGLFVSGVNQAGGRVWASTSEITQSEFASIVAQSEGRVTVLTGTHGTPAGALVPERMFFQEDLATWASQTANVKLIDVSRLSSRQMSLVLGRDGNVICGWCFSANNPAVKAAVGGGF